MMDPRAEIIQQMQVRDNSNLDAIARVLKANPDLLNAPLDQSGNTVLHLAVLENQKNVVPMLLRQDGIQLNAVNSQGQTANDICRDIIENESDPRMKNAARENLSNITQAQRAAPIVKLVDPGLKNIDREALARVDDSKVSAFTDAKIRSINLVQSEPLSHQNLNAYYLARDTAATLAKEGFGEFNKTTFDTKLSDRLISESGKFGPDVAISLVKNFQDNNAPFLKQQPQQASRLGEMIDVQQRILRGDKEDLARFVRATKEIAKQDPQFADIQIQFYKQKHEAFIRGNPGAREILSNLREEIRVTHSDPGVQSTQAKTADVRATQSAPAPNSNAPVTSSSATLQSQATRPDHHSPAAATPDIPANAVTRGEARARTIVRPSRTSGTVPSTPPPAAPTENAAPAKEEAEPSRRPGRR